MVSLIHQQKERLPLHISPFIACNPRAQLIGCIELIPSSTSGVIKTLVQGSQETSRERNDCLHAKPLPDSKAPQEKSTDKEPRLACAHRGPKTHGQHHQGLDQGEQQIIKYCVCIQLSCYQLMDFLKTYLN